MAYVSAPNDLSKIKTKPEKDGRARETLTPEKRQVG